MWVLWTLLAVPVFAGGTTGFAAHVAQLEEAAARSPGDPAPALRLAQGLGSRGELEVALGWCAEAAARGADALQVRIVRADAYAVAGRREEAVRAYYEVVVAAPRQAYAHLRLWALLRRTADLPPALDARRLKTELTARGYLSPSGPEGAPAPGLAQSLSERGEAALRAGRFRAAAEAFEEAITADDGRAGAWRGLGEARSRLRQEDAAIAAYRLFLFLEARETRDTRQARRIVHDAERRRGLAPR